MSAADAATLVFEIVLLVLGAWLAICFATDGRPYWPERKRVPMKRGAANV